MKKILLVEDKRGMRVMLTAALQEDGWQVTAVQGGNQALEELASEKYDAVLTDVCLPGRISGIDVLHSAPRGCRVVVMTAFGTVDMAVNAMKTGASDFISKPFELDELLGILRRICPDSPGEMVGKSEQFHEAISRAKRAAGSGMNVLVMGESGTGKELLARMIHRTSDREAGPFIPVNCAAIPANLMESELFGAEKGAYTGSSEARPGRFTMASGGVIFLDEIGDMELGLQGKLLRVLESGTYHSVGGTEELFTDALVISASNRNLKELTEKGLFREDLYYRIAEFPVTLPPLRERGEDRLLLAEHFLKMFGGSILSPCAVQAIENYSWPGNVREMRTLVRRACVNSAGGEITSELLEFQCDCSEKAVSSGNLREESAAAARKREKELIEKALEVSEGNRTKAASALGVSYRTLLTKIKELGLEK
ncbi:hypothetical protein CSA37_05025 [Candidatus Fermentibacteria bacterium]|nr:MAG: hypothetical protein CSA37_10315 [Candidatus Fermentibacteria bacterium]PIE52291.1 MAG: hypothetical protein CSA37_07420 [Candidatus Fermentibacteria bacterium]PIE52786.1 MAG: hypothetical protein CSA37_05025 [Candidatus Fermentibacteria bacterium]